MFIRDEILDKANDFNVACRNHNVKYLYAFGSAITPQFDDSKSDIDLLVEIDDPDPIERGDKLLSLWDTFENLFQRRVDLLTDKSIHNPYLKRSIDLTKILIYDGTKQKILI